MAAPPTTDQDEVPDLVGHTLPGGWAVLRHIAEGGMAHVYEGQKADGVRGAIKVLHTHILGKPELAFRFRREGEIVESIKSPHVPQVLARGKDERGRPFMVFEFVEGLELTKILDEHVRLPPAVALEITLQMCEAVRVAHLAGIVHRDMKPDNVIIVGPLSAPVVKVLDFSVSKDEDLALTQQGHVMGTPCYMALEQALGEPITPLADIYSVGAILYDMLTGRPPYEPDEPGRVLAALLSKEPPRAIDLNPAIPPVLATIVETAMARSPKKRYPFIESMIEALRAASTSITQNDVSETLPPPEPTFLANPAPEERAATFEPVPDSVSRRRRGPCSNVSMAVVVIGALLLLLVAAAVIFGSRR